MKNKSTIFVKIKYNEDHNQKDKGHISYIESRPGVEKVKVDADAAHVQYADSRPRSTGLFGPNPNKVILKEDVIREIDCKKKKCSWRIIISLREEDARNLGYVERKDWEDLTRRNMQQFARAIGMEYEDIKWAAAYHPEQGHPHVHVQAWPSDEAPNRRGALSKLEMKEFKRCIAREIFGEYRLELSALKTMFRNGLIDLTKEGVKGFEGEGIIKLKIQSQDPHKSLSPKFYANDLDELQNRLQTLAQIMPGKGRAYYAYMPDNVKAEVMKTVDFMLDKPQLKKVLDQYEKVVKELTRIYTLQEIKADISWEKEKQELKKRIANQILREAAKINKLQQKETRIGNYTKREADFSVSFNAYRSVFRILDRERLKSQAQAELSRLKDIQRSTRNEKLQKKLQMGISLEEAYKNLEDESLR